LECHRIVTEKKKNEPIFFFAILIKRWAQKVKGRYINHHIFRFFFFKLVFLLVFFFFFSIVQSLQLALFRA
jgi:hypothetical protein